MNGYRSEQPPPRRRFPLSQNRHPVDVFSDDTEFQQPFHQQNSQSQNNNNTFSPIREHQSSTIRNPGIFYCEYRSGRSSVPAHLLNSLSNSEPIFNRTHPSQQQHQQQQQRIPFIDTASDFDYPLTPKQILDTFQNQQASDWTNNKQSNNPWQQPQNLGELQQQQIFDNWSPSKPQSHHHQQQSQQQDINNTPLSTKVPWRQNTFQSISDNNSALLSK